MNFNHNKQVNRKNSGYDKTKHASKKKDRVIEKSDTSSDKLTAM